eukprot:TRINITY_DN24663_c0_g1_i1.p1 TRINITY_DN24663_c0_g1~~TRINITY_DN24663_c0_g1_i1.p1  ORF type:complete len:1268 (+),score=291.41 TRINITY_DN24663_c0_g1_i1:96-3899(+)
MEHGPHSPHPPPAALTPAPRRVSQLLSAVQYLGNNGAVQQVQERLETYEEKAEAHYERVHAITEKLKASQEKVRAYESVVYKNKKAPPLAPLASDDVENACVPVIPMLGGHPPQKALELGQRRVAALKAKLASLRQDITRKNDTWLEREQQHSTEVAALKSEIVQQVLVEREIGVLKEKTSRHLPLKTVKKLDQRVSSTFEKAIMEAHDDVSLAQLPVHDVGRAVRPAPTGSKVAVAMINTLNVEDAWANPANHAAVLEGQHVFRRVLKAALVESKSGYESVCQGFNSLVAFESINDAIPWCLSFLSNVQRHNPKLFQTRIGVDVGTVQTQLNYASTRFTYFGAPVAGAAHVCQFGQPYELVVTKEAQQGIDIEVVYSMREVRGLKKRKGELQPPPRCMICSYRGEAAAPAQQWRQSDSDSDSDGSAPSARKQKKVQKKIFQPLDCWWANTGARRDRPWELPLEPRRRQKKPRIVPTVLEHTEYEIMRNNDSILRKPAPTGTVTLVFTDVQSSTALWDKQPVAMKRALAVHNKVMRANIERFCGYEVRTEGDAFMVAFSEARLALGWCMNVQRELLLIDWPEDILQEEPACVEHEYDSESQEYKTLYNGLRVRMGFNTCEPQCQVSNINHRMGYFGPSVHLCAAVSNVGRGGETVIGYNSYKAITRHGKLDDVAIIPLGPSKLGGISKPESIFSVYPVELARRPALTKIRDEEKESKAKLMIDHAAERKGSRAILSQQQLDELAKLDRFLPKFARRMRSVSAILSRLETQHMRGAEGSAAPQIPPQHDGHVYLVYSDIPSIHMLWQTSTDVCKATIQKHNIVLRRVCERFGGKELRADGCAHLLAFSYVVDALSFCLAVQRELLMVPDWDVSLRNVPDFEPVYGKGGGRYFWGPRVGMGFNKCAVVPADDPWQLECVADAMKKAAKVSSFARGGEIAVGFDAFAELTVIDEERGGEVFYQCKVYEKGEHVVLKDHAEYVHIVIPNGQGARWEYWNATIPPTRRVPNYWVSDPKSERFEVACIFHPPPEMSNCTLTTMLREVAKMLTALREWALEDPPRRGEGVSLYNVPQRYTARLIAFVANLYQRVLMERKKEFNMHRFRTPLNADDRERIIVEIEDAFLGFAWELELMARKNRDRGVTGASYLQKIQKDVKKEQLDGNFNPVVAKQLMLEFSAIDEDFSGTIHMNEVLRSGFQFSYLSGPFDEKLFKRMDRDRDGVISYFEMLRFFFPKTKPVLLQRWLDQELAQLRRQNETFAQQATRRQTIAR